MPKSLFLGVSIALVLVVWPAALPAQQRSPLTIEAVNLYCPWNPLGTDRPGRDLFGDVRLTNSSRTRVKDLVLVFEFIDQAGQRKYAEETDIPALDPGRSWTWTSDYFIDFGNSEVRTRATILTREGEVLTSKASSGPDERARYR